MYSHFCFCSEYFCQINCKKQKNNNYFQNYIVTFYTGTYAVQSVRINELSAFLEVECVFAPNTEAIGCEVKIIFLLNNEVVENITMRADRTGDSALMTFLKDFADEYGLYVFEIEKTGSVVQVDVLTGLFTLSIQQITSKSVRVLSATPTLFQMASSTYLISKYHNL